MQLTKTIPLFAALAMSTLVQASPETNHAASAVVNQSMPRANEFWWPKQLNLSPLRQNSAESNPMDKDFNLRKLFKA
ncbi:MAG: hypothetical protein AB7D28_10840 [Candidatus Berkiella sp.]